MESLACQNEEFDCGRKVFRQLCNILKWMPKNFIVIVLRKIEWNSKELKARN